MKSTEGVVELPITPAEFAGNPFLVDVRAELSSDMSGSEDIATAHLSRPWWPATTLAAQCGTTTEPVLETYRRFAGSRAAARLVHSAYYPHRLLVTTAESLCEEFTAEPGRLDAIRRSEPVMARTVEIHASRGACSYSCAMCLWSDKSELTYRKLGLNTGGPMSAREWGDLLQSAQSAGARLVVVSGGGEALMNPELPDVIDAAKAYGLDVHVYTTGYHLTPDDKRLWRAVLGADQVRFSIHSPNPDTYDAITGLPAERRSLDRVRSNAAALLGDRGPNLRVGIGYVAQPLNAGQLGAMASWSADLGVDYLAVRRDEVDVTGMTECDLGSLAAEVRDVRYRLVDGAYGPTLVDLGDNLVALANGQDIVSERARACFVKVVRPTVSPFGRVTACDLKAEPRFSDVNGQFGSLRDATFDLILERMATTHVDATCAQCMPSSRATNLVLQKLLDDVEAGIPVADQPFVVRQQQLALHES